MKKLKIFLLSIGAILSVVSTFYLFFNIVISLYLNVVLVGIFFLMKSPRFREKNNDDDIVIK